MDGNQQMTTAGGGVALEERAMAFASEMGARFRQLDPARRKWLIGAGAFLLASIVALGWYASRPDWRTLYAGLSPDDARAMAAELTAANIPFDVSPDGTALRVTADNLDKARLAVTAKGGPRSGRMGFELFDKPNWIGSEFDEKVNYQRALEGELEHTIDTLSDVESSRVNLVMPHDSLFTDDQRAAKASVVLTLRRQSISDDEATAIRNLVASAVDDLQPQNVTLVDSSGEQLGRTNSTEQDEAHEQELAGKLIQTLEPVAGEGNVRASVNVEYDTSTSDEVDKTYDPNDVVTLSMQRSQQTAGGPPGVSGVPGTASNAPNTKPPVYPHSTPQSESETQESGTYGASEKVIHTTQGTGRIRRITAAVLINQIMTLNGKKVSWQPRGPEEMKRLTELAEAAIGYDASRGDTVSVVDLPFDDQSVQPAPLSQRLLAAAAESGSAFKYAVILLSLLGLLLFVVRPMTAAMKYVETAALKAPVEASTAESVLEAPADPAVLAADSRKQHMQRVFDDVTDHLRREPAQSTRLLQSWIQSD
ncbi:MAG TPA: flagellar basal-body MS-ring/collar protein FliF [Acidobacteriaceae bacterium]|nr:flagellar basal-body MS-ring/collar protein FliF [Acidobacteriaceae bacterium]